MTGFWIFLGLIIKRIKTMGTVVFWIIVGVLIAVCTGLI